MSNVNRFMTEGDNGPIEVTLRREYCVSWTHSQIVPGGTVVNTLDGKTLRLIVPFEVFDAWAGQ